MATAVTMPKMGFDMTEGTILSWTKAEGDAVEKGDILAEIETGKVNIEIEAYDAGVLRKILVGEGATVDVGTPIAIIAGADEEIELPEPPAAPAAAVESPDAMPPAETAAAPAPGPVPLAEDEPRRASPLARRLADENGIDLRAVPGSGPNGRVVRDDVQAVIAAGAAAPTPAPVRSADTTDQRDELSRMRQTIARRLSGSWAAAPHIFLTMAIDMDEALDLRRQVNASLEAVDRGRVSVNDLVVKAAARALRAHPLVNVSWADGARLVRGRVHVGVAVALDDGLITITVPDADVRPISEIAADVAERAERARQGKLTPDDLAAQSTFTVSNLGTFGLDSFTAIINPPEAAILAVGAATPTPVVRDGEVVIRTVMKVTLSADHRVIDGAAAADFLATLRDMLEHPLTMLV